MVMARRLVAALAAAAFAVSGVAADYWWHGHRAVAASASAPTQTVPYAPGGTYYDL